MAACTCVHWNCVPSTRFDHESKFWCWNIWICQFASIYSTIIRDIIYFGVFCGTTAVLISNVWYVFSTAGLRHIIANIELKSNFKLYPVLTDKACDTHCEKCRKNRACYLSTYLRNHAMIKTQWARCQSCSVFWNLIVVCKQTHPSTLLVCDDTPIDKCPLSAYIRRYYHNRFLQSFWNTF